MCLKKAVIWNFYIVIFELSRYNTDSGRLCFTCDEIEKFNFVTVIIVMAFGGIVFCNHSIGLPCFLMRFIRVL